MNVGVTMAVATAGLVFLGPEVARLARWVVGPAGTPEERRRLNERFQEVFERIRRENHRMGPDVPYWVEDALDAFAMIAGGMWKGVQRGFLLGVTVASLWEMFAVFNQLSTDGWISAWHCTVSFSVLGAASGMLTATWRGHA